MRFLDTINLFERLKFRGLSQRQNEGLVDLVACAAIVDDELDPEEREEMEHALGRLRWRGEVGLGAYIDGALGRAQAHLRAGRLREYVEAAHRALGADEGWFHEEAYLMCGMIVGADDALRESERELMAQVVSTFRFSAAKHRELTSRLIREDYV